MEGVCRTPKRARVTGLPGGEEIAVGRSGTTEKGLQSGEEEKKRPRKDSEESPSNEGGEETIQETEKAPEQENDAKENEEDRKRAQKDARVQLILADLPNNGTLTRIDKDDIERYSKSYGPLPTFQPTRKTRYKTVKSDDTNILVRALRMQKKRAREEKRQGSASKSKKKEVR